MLHQFFYTTSSTFHLAVHKIEFKLHNLTCFYCSACKVPSSNVLFSFIMFSSIKTVPEPLYLLLSCTLCLRSPHNVIALAVKLLFAIFTGRRERNSAANVFFSANKRTLVALHHYSDNKGVYLMTVKIKRVVPWLQIQCRHIWLLLALCHIPKGFVKYCRRA